MATKTGTITAKPTKSGAMSAKITNTSAFLADTGDLSVSSMSSVAGFLYGFDFSELQNLKNVVITGISFTVSAKAYNYSTSGSLKGRFVTNFSVSGTSTDSYTDLGDGSIAFLDKITDRNNYSTQTTTQSTLPKTLAWMNSNLTKLINGYTSNTFGFRIYVAYSYVKSITLTLTYSYEEDTIPTYTVSTSVSPAGAGTVSPSSQTVEEGATASVTATPNAGYRFSHWLINGADSGVTTPTLSRTITADTLCTAVFVLDKINKIYIGTSQPKAIYVGTQEVKEVYVGTTKVFG